MMKEKLSVTTEIESFFWKPKNPRLTTLVHISQPTPLEQRNLGQLFIISEISSDHKINQQILESIREEIESSYYGTNEMDQSRGFEKALSQANQKIATLVQETGSGFLQELSIAVGIYYGKSIFFAQAGEIHAYIIHKDNIADLLEKNSSTEITQPNKIFSNIFSGKIDGTDSFVLCTSSLLDYLSLEKLKRIINGYNHASESVSELEKLLLNDHGTETNFATIILKSVPIKHMEPEKEGKHVTLPNHGGQHRFGIQREDSMDNLVKQEQRTSELLTPSIWPNVKEIIKTLKENLFNRGEEVNSRETLQNKEIGKDEVKEEITDMTPAVKKDPLLKKADLTARTTQLKNILVTTMAFLKMVTLKILSGILTGIKKIGSLRKKKNITANIKTLPYRTNKSLSKGIINLKNLSRNRKILLIGAIVLIVIFSWSISRLGSKKEQEETIARHENQIVAASDKQLAAESNIIFNNEADARKLLQEARDLLAAIPDDVEQVTAKKQELSQKIETTSRQINHIVEVSDPKVQTDFSQVDPSITPERTFLAGGNLVHVSSDNSKFFRTNLSSSETTSVPANSPVTAGLKEVVKKESDDYVRLHEDNTFSTYSDDRQTVTVNSFERSPDNAQLRDFTIFNQRLYILDPAANQIFKYNPAGSGFSVAGPWITGADVDIRDGASLTIDGSIFVLKSDGSVLKLFNGAKANFTLETIEPALTSATTITTSENLQNIYITDPNNKRVVVFDKQGKLLNQYTSEKFDNIKNVDIDEGNKKLYILSGQKVYSIDM